MSQELLNHKSKCRLCLESISVSRNTSKITGNVQQKFFKLTNIELKSSDKFSNSICKTCIKSLNESSEFQLKMIDNQQRLYAFEDEEKLIVKIEPLEEEIIKQEVNFEILSNLKTEIFEDSELPQFKEVEAEESDDDWFAVKPKGLFSCDICGHSATKKNYLSRHMNTHHISRKNKREVCSEFKCKECGKVFAKFHFLKAHQRFKHETGEYKCSKCGLVFQLFKNLATHRKKHYDIIPCEICGKQVQRGTNMTLHLASHEPPKFKCTFEGCSATYQIRQSLKYHILNIHTTKETIKCPKCDATFPNMQKLRKHDGRSHGERKYVCPVENCTYGSTRRDYFRVHIKTHRNIDVKRRDEIIAKSSEFRVPKAGGERDGSNLHSEGSSQA